MTSESEHDALLEGWRRRVCQRTKGRSAGRCDVYLYTPSGKRLRSRREVAAFLRVSLSTLPQHFNFRPPRSVTRSASTDVPGEDKAPPASRSLPAADNKPSTSSASAQNEGRVLPAGDSGEKGSFPEAAAASTSSEDSTTARPNLGTEGSASEVPLNDAIEAVASRRQESAALERPVEPSSAVPENETKARPVSGAASLFKGRHVSPEKRTRLDRATGKPPLAENFGRKRNTGTIALRGGKKEST
ncbi:hypothetical protein MRX96_006854 [Rhipicephalus microplus]